MTSLCRRPALALRAAIPCFALCLGLGLAPAALVAQLNENFDGVTRPDLPPGWTSSISEVTWISSTTFPDTGPNSAFVNTLGRPADRALVLSGDRHSGGRPRAAELSEHLLLSTAACSRSRSPEAPSRTSPQPAVASSPAVTPGRSLRSTTRSSGATAGSETAAGTSRATSTSRARPAATPSACAGAWARTTPSTPRVRTPTRSRRGFRAGPSTRSASPWRGSRRTSTP